MHRPRHPRRTHGDPRNPIDLGAPICPMAPWLAGVTTRPRPGQTLRWRRARFITSEGLALFHFVSREALQRDCHVFDGGMFVLIRYSSGSVTADFVSYPLLDPSPGCTCAKGMAPSVIWLNGPIGDPKLPHPFGQSL